MYYEEETPKEQTEVTHNFPETEKDIDNENMETETDGGLAGIDAPHQPLSFLEIVYGVLTHPAETFTYLALARPIKQAAGFLVIITLCNFVAGLQDIRALEFGAELPIEGSAFLVPLFLLGLLGAFLAWFLNTAAISLVSQLFGGRGNGLGLLCGFSFAMVPVLITGIIEFVVQFFPFKPFFMGLISLAGVIWLISLDIIALGQIEQLSTKRAILVYFAVPMSIIVSVLVLVGVAMAVLAPWLSQLPLQLK